MLRGDQRRLRGNRRRLLDALSTTNLPLHWQFCTQAGHSRELMAQLRISQICRVSIGSKMFADRNHSRVVFESCNSNTWSGSKRHLHDRFQGWHGGTKLLSHSQTQGGRYFALGWQCFFNIFPGLPLKNEMGHNSKPWEEN